MSGGVVTVSNVSKRFRLGSSPSAFGLVREWFRRRGRTSSRSEKEFWALRDVDFEVRRGEAFGIIGPNGAGKSTILKLLAGILRPDAGDVRVLGRLAALIEVGAGFHGDLTGRENIFLNGCILGMSRSEIRRKLDAIVAFSGLERFLDMPIKRYSSGMYARLGFSVAAHTDPSVLLVDEVLSVGDAVFRVRCLERMRELVRAGTALVFVTHDLEQMRSICDRALVLDGGRAVFQGPSGDAVTHHLRAMTSTAGRSPDIVGAEQGSGDAVERIREVSLRFTSGGREDVGVVSASTPLRIELTFRMNGPVTNAVVELNARTAHGLQLLSLNTARSGFRLPSSSGCNTVRALLPALPLAGGEYFWNVRVWDADRGTSLVDTPFRFPMLLRNDAPAAGALCLDHTWSCANATVPATERSERDSSTLEEKSAMRTLRECEVAVVGSPSS